MSASLDPTGSPQAAPRRGMRLIVGLVMLAVLGALLWSLLTIGNPFPPRTIALATGSEGGSYQAYGERYRDVLRRSGVDVQLVESNGAVDNIARLRDPASGVSAAFVVGGLTSSDSAPGIGSLGAVSLEPVWLFVRGRPGGTLTQRLAGKRISIGPDGSGTRVVALRLLALNGLGPGLELRDLPPEPSADALLHGDIDAALMITSWGSKAVQTLLAADGVTLEGFPRADAYVARFPSFSKVVLPMGAADLARNVPPADVSLIALETSLLVRDDLHPALQYLLLEAATAVHGGSEVFHRAGRYPAAEGADLLLTEEARRFYKSGQPFLYQYLPFWLAGLGERLLVLLVPLIGIVLPLINIVPAVYQYVIERRIFLMYRELESLELDLERVRPGPQLDRIADALGDLARRANRLRVPLPYAQRLFIFKSHVTLAQQEADKHRESPAQPA